MLWFRPHRTADSSDRVGIGMRIVANDKFEANAPDYPDFAWMPVDKLMRESDVVSLHCPLFPENKGMINRERLAR